MSGMVSKEVIDRIRNSLDIADVIGSYIQIKRAGPSVAKALCPFHKEKTPSFTINTARQVFHCFGCGEGGDIFKFVMRFENVDFPTALRMMAARAGVPLEFEESGGQRRSGPAKDEIFAANEDATKRYQRELLESPAAEAARAYLRGRALDPAVWREWGIGFAPDMWDFLSRSAGPRDGPQRKVLNAAGLLSSNEKGDVYDRFRGRVMFTIRDEQGRTVGFSGRLLKEKEGVGKYVNTSETPVFRKSRILFGLDKAKRPILDHGRALLCEGQIDCIRCHLAGFNNTVASQGTAFTSEHAHILKRYTDSVVIVLDADNAGRKAAMRTAELLLEEGLSVSLAALPAGEDPDSLLLKGGADAFSAVLDQAKSPVGFLLEFQREKENLGSQEGLLRAMRAVVELTSHAQGAVQTEKMLREAAPVLGASLSSLQAELSRMMKTVRRSSSYSANASGARGARPSASPSRPAPKRGPSPEDVNAALDAAAAVDGINIGADAAPSPDFVATGVPSSAPAVPAPPPPVAEQELATLLLCSGTPEIMGFVRTWLPYTVMVNPSCRTIVRALAEEEEDLMSALDGESEECMALAARLANQPPKTISNEASDGPRRAVQDCVRLIWKSYLLAKRQQLLARLHGVKDETARQKVMHELGRVLDDLPRLHEKWDVARPVLEARLQEMVDL